MSEVKHGDTLSIQERIRAMNETLDTVDRKPSSVVANGNSSNNNNDDNESISTLSVQKRSSVVDIWRKRENGGDLAKSTGGRVSKSSSILNKDESSNSREALNDVKAELSSRYLGGGGGGGVSASLKSTILEFEEKKESDDRLSPSSRSEKKYGPIRGTAPTSLTPPALPGSNRKSYSLPVAPTPSVVSVKKATPKPMYNEPADLTILPAASSASSTGETVSSKRSSKMVSLWQRLSGGGSSSSNKLAPTAVEQPLEPIEPAVETPPPKRKSVVDIWQKRSSPSTDDPDALSVASVPLRTSEPKFDVSVSPPPPLALKPVKTLSPRLVPNKTPPAKSQQPQHRVDRSPELLDIIPTEASPTISLKKWQQRGGTSEDQAGGCKPSVTSPWQQPPHRVDRSPALEIIPAKSLEASPTISVKKWQQRGGASVELDARKSDDQAGGCKPSLTPPWQQSQQRVDRSLELDIVPARSLEASPTITAKKWQQRGVASVELDIRKSEDQAGGCKPSLTPPWKQPQQRVDKSPGMDSVDAKPFESSPPNPLKKWQQRGSATVVVDTNKSEGRASGGKPSEMIPWKQPQLVDSSLEMDRGTAKSLEISPTKPLKKWQQRSSATVEVDTIKSEGHANGGKPSEMTPWEQPQQRVDRSPKVEMDTAQLLEISPTKPLTKWQQRTSATVEVDTNKSEGHAGGGKPSEITPWQQPQQRVDRSSEMDMGTARSLEISPTKPLKKWQQRGTATVELDTNKSDAHSGGCKPSEMTPERADTSPEMDIVNAKSLEISSTKPLKHWRQRDAATEVPDTHKSDDHAGGYKQSETLQQPQQRVDGSPELEIHPAKPSEFSSTTLLKKWQQRGSAAVACDTMKSEDHASGCKPSAPSPSMLKKTPGQNRLQEHQVGGSAGVDIVPAAARKQEQAALPKRSVSVAHRWAQRMYEHIQTSNLVEEKEEAKTSPAESTASLPVVSSSGRVLDRWLFRADNQPQQDFARVDISDTMSLGGSQVRKSPARTKERWRNTNLERSDSLSAEAEAGEEPAQHPILSTNKFAERCDLAREGNSSAMILSNEKSPAVQPPPPVTSDEKAKEGSPDRFLESIVTPSKVGGANERWRNTNLGRIDSRSAEFEAGEEPVQHPILSNNKIAERCDLALGGNSSSRSFSNEKSPVVEPPPLVTSDEKAKEGSPDRFLESIVTPSKVGGAVNENEPDAAASPSLVEGNVQSGPNTLLAFGTGRGKVTDRYEVQGSTPSPGIRRSISGSKPSLMKDHDVRTPTRQLPNNVSGRWNEGLKSPDKALVDSAALPKHGSEIIDAWLEAKKGSEVFDAVKATAERTIAQVIAEESVSEIEKQAEQERKTVAGRWSMPNVTASTSIGVTRNTPSVVPKSRGNVTDRWKLQSDLPVSSSAIDNANVVQLLKVHSGQTPAGMVRSKRLGGQPTHLNDTSSSLAPHSGDHDFDGSVLEAESGSNISDRQNNHASENDVAPTAGFAVSKNVVALVNAHVGQTLFGAKRGASFGRRRGDGEADAAISETGQSTSQQQANEEEACESPSGFSAAANVLGRVDETVLEEPLESFAQPIRDDVADSCKKRLGRSEDRPVESDDGGDFDTKAASTEIRQMLPNQSGSKDDGDRQVPSPRVGNTLLDAVDASSGENDTDQRRTNLDEVPAYGSLATMDIATSAALAFEESKVDPSDSDEKTEDIFYSQSGLHEAGSLPPRLIGQSETQAVGDMIVPEGSHDADFGVAEVGLSGGNFDHLMASRCDFDASHPPAVSSEKTPSDDKSLRGEGQAASSFIVCAASLRREQANPEFFRVSRSEMPVPDGELQDCPADDTEKNDDKGPDLCSPLRIIQAWSEQVAPNSIIPSDDLNRNNTEEDSREAIRVSVPSTKSGLSAASDEISAHERELTSPFHIIEAWTQRSSEPPISAKLPKPANLRKDVHSSRAALETAVFEHNVTVVRPANASAFAPWNSGVESNTEDGIGLLDEIPRKNKKHIMELGRKHIVNLSQQRPEVTAKGKSSDEPAHAGTATSDDSSKRMDVSDVRTFKPGPFSFPKADANLKSSRSNGEKTDEQLITKKQRAADEPLSPSALIQILNSGGIGAKNLGNPAHEEKVITLCPPNSQDSGHQQCTPVVSNRRGLSSVQDAQPKKASAILDKEVEPTSVSSTLSKKLASDKMSNKRRMQLYRKKASKTRAVEGVPYKQEHIENEDAVVGRDPSFHSNDYIDCVLAGDLAGQVARSTPDLAPFCSDSPQRTTPCSGLTLSRNVDLDNVVRSPDSVASQSHLSDSHNSAFADICKTSSTVSASSLTNKAEKLLQERRRRSSASEDQRNTTEAAGRGLGVNDSQVAGDLPRIPLPEAAQYDLEDTLFIGHSDREEELIDNGRPRLSTRYNTSSRFIDADGSIASISASGMTTDGYESNGSSCVQSMESATTGSDSRFFGVDRHVSEKRKETSKRRQPPVNGATVQLSEEKSVNLSSQSLWDSDWVTDASVSPFDFKKLATAVDERVAALRDFVGVGSQKTMQNEQSKPSLRLPLLETVPLDVEDVAIEVEYVEDSSDDDDPEADLGFCTAPLDDVVERSLQCSAETKTNLGMDFTSACSEMLPAGEPSFEEKPASRKNGRRSGYV